MFKPSEPAFPRTSHVEGPYGLTKREYFAAQALTAMVTTWPNDLCSKERVDRAVDAAVTLADAVLVKLHEVDRGSV